MGEDSLGMPGTNWNQKGDCDTEQKGNYTEFEMEDADCPECGYTMNRASSDQGEKPEVGDISICLNCGAINQFTEHMFLEPWNRDTEGLTPETVGGMLLVSLEIKERGLFHPKKEDVTDG
jgi:hypothetical protein